VRAVQGLTSPVLFRRAKIKATSEDSFQSYASCLKKTGNDLKKCAALGEALEAAFYKE
jgi:hypothetical protein